MVEFKKLSVWENWLGVSITITYLVAIFIMACIIRFPLYGEFEMRLSDDSTVALCMSGDKPFLPFGEIDADLLIGEVTYSCKISSLPDLQIRIRMEKSVILYPQTQVKVVYQQSLCELFWNMIRHSTAD